MQFDSIRALFTSVLSPTLYWCRKGNICIQSEFRVVLLNLATAYQSKQVFCHDLNFTQSSCSSRQRVNVLVNHVVINMIFEFRFEFYYLHEISWKSFKENNITFVTRIKSIGINGSWLGAINVHVSSHDNIWIQ